MVSLRQYQAPTAFLLSLGITSVLWNSAVGAVVGAGAAGIIGDRTITTENVLTGAASGATLGGIIDPDQQRVVIIKPNTDLTLRLDQPWQIPPR